MNKSSRILQVILSLFILLTCTTAFAQKKKGIPKLDKRRFDIEIREVAVEAKKYEKDVFEFTPKEIVSDGYFETKFKIPTVHYTTSTDSTYTEEGEEIKYWTLSVLEKTGKSDEEIHGEIMINGKEISGKLNLMKGDVIKKTYEFEGTQKF